jgi:hypothetical protein
MPAGSYQPYVMPSVLFTLAEAVMVLQLAQSKLTVTVSRLLAPNYQPSVMFVLTTSAEAVLQLALSWLAAAVFKLPAENYQTSVMPSVPFTPAE